MNFDDALKQYLPRAWFGFKSIKYKYFKRGEREIWLVRHLIEPGSTALDIGASIGLYAAEMARYARKVIAFEANPQVAAFARTVAARNVEVVNSALSSSGGRASLKIPLNPKGQPIDELATIEADNPLHASDSGSIDVEMKRLDDFAIANCSFIKIDVEGHEEAVLDGAAALIARERPVLMLELDETLNKGSLARVAERYAALSYRGFFLSHGKLRPVAEFVSARDQDETLLKYARHRLPAGREYINNFVFVPEESVPRILNSLLRKRSDGNLRSEASEDPLMAPPRRLISALSPTPPLQEALSAFSVCLGDAVGLYNLFDRHFAAFASWHEKFSGELICLPLRAFLVRYFRFETQTHRPS